jgi:hypothetical protein
MLVETAKILNAEESKAIGLLDELVPEGKAFEAAFDYARLIAQRASVAVDMARRLIHRSQDCHARGHPRLRGGGRHHGGIGLRCQGGRHGLPREAQARVSRDLRDPADRVCAAPLCRSTGRTRIVTGLPSGRV